MCNRLKDNKFNILIFIASIIIIFLAYRKNIINLRTDFSSGDHFNIITINSILGGFLFTGLGIIISGLGSEKIKRLQRGGYLLKYYITIFISLFFTLISLIAALLIIFTEKTDNLILLCAEQPTIFIAVIFFMKAMVNLIKIIRKISEV